ncbi:hypothetical protein HA402_008383 [Bradysia odoriphaga]|nr:hypothetical protein HA402_008383 [Bradysia odoriphaga]
MQNCSRPFNEYTHTELRPPRGGNGAAAANHKLSVDAPEFVPQTKIPSMDVGVVPHQQHTPYQPYHQMPHQVQHHNPHTMNHNNQMNHNHTNQKRSGRFSAQDRLGLGGPISHHQQQQHHHHHHHQQQQHHHHQHYNVGSSMGGGSGYHQQQQQQQQQQQHHQQNNSDVRGSNPSEAESHVLSFLIEVMRKLNADPGSFESYQKELNSLYLEYAHNEFVISNAIEIIFDQSINEQNFRYMGARICRLLDALDASPDSVFRHLLRLKMNYNQEENMAFITNDAHKVRGTTLFLAELYIQLQNDGHRIGDVAKSIYKAISLLLQKTTPENIKCVCQTLKLCGYELEIDFPMEAADVLSILKQVKDIDVSTERLLKSVLELSQNRWGRTEAVLNAPIIEHNIQPNYSNDPVFYGPDGEIITEEESKFLSDIPAYPNFDYCEDSNDADELAEPEPEMDLEIQMAFKDFVKSQHNQK